MKNNLGGDLKIVVVGNSGTGKTSFVNKWTKNTFNEKYKATIVSEFSYKIVNIDGIIYRIQLWDLAGQDRNTCVTKIFCKDAHGAIIMSDCNEKQTLLETEKWKICIEDNSTFIDDSALPIMLIDNKYDIIEEKQNVYSDKEIEDFSNKNNFIKSFRTSAKTGMNVIESMEYLIKFIINKINKIDTKKLKNKKDFILIQSTKKKKKNSCC